MAKSSNLQCFYGGPISHCSTLEIQDRKEARSSIWIMQKYSRASPTDLHFMSLYLTGTNHSRVIILGRRKWTTHQTCWKNKTQEFQQIPSKSWDSHELFLYPEGRSECTFVHSWILERPLQKFDNDDKPSTIRRILWGCLFSPVEIEQLPSHACCYHFASDADATSHALLLCLFPCSSPFKLPSLSDSTCWLVVFYHVPCRYVKVWCVTMVASFALTIFDCTHWGRLWN